MKNPGIYSAIDKKVLFLAAGLLLISACATMEPPTQQLTQTQAAVDQAKQIGARDYAPLEIREAEKKLDEARKLVEQEQYDEAKLLAEEALVDAELAEVKTLSGKAQKAVEQLRMSIKTLKEEIARNQQKN